MTFLSRGKELEELVLERLEWESRNGFGTGNRYGVQAICTGDIRGVPQWQIVRSLPDIEGVVFGGRQFIAECKVCSAASLALDSGHFRDRQYSHLKERGRMGAVAFVLVHFNARKLVTKEDPAETWAVPIAPGMVLWEEYEAEAVRSLSRAACSQYGERVAWDIPARCHKPRPDILDAVRRLSHRFDGLAFSR